MDSRKTDDNLTEQEEQIDKLAVIDAGLTHDFEFFANLIRSDKKLTSEVRDVAAAVLLRMLNGVWKSRHVRSKILTEKKLDRIAERVCELEINNGTESAVNQAAKEFDTSERWVWKAVGRWRKSESTSMEVVSKALAMIDAGANPDEVEAFLKEGMKALSGILTLK